MNVDELKEIVELIRNEIRRVLYIYKETRTETCDMVDVNGNPTGIVRKLTEDEVIKKVIEQV